MKKCKGCGVLLQNEDKTQIGYTPKLDGDYCQRCFRMMHYDDVTINMQTSIAPDKILQEIASRDALVLWVADLFDFEANIVKGMNRHLAGKDIILVVTKRDLLPESVGNQKLGQFLMKRLKEKDIYVRGIVICGDLVENASAKDNYSIEEVNRAIDVYRKGRDVIVMGMANAGKSTLLNGLMNSTMLTTSRHPGTTLDFNPIEMDGYTMYDTPGLTRMDSMLTYADSKLLKAIVPTKRIKPKVFQIKDDQSFALGGLVRLDLTKCKDATCTCYFARGLQVHRSKVENANRLWSEHLGELLSPTLDTNYTDMKILQTKKNKKKLDVVIHGLGWFSLSGNIEEVKVYVNEKVDVTFREGMI